MRGSRICGASRPISGEVFLDDYFTDSFTESVNTALISHSPELGGVWTKESGAAQQNIWGGTEYFTYPLAATLTKYSTGVWWNNSSYPIKTNPGHANSLVAPLPSKFRIELGGFRFNGSWGTDLGFQIGNTLQSNGLVLGFNSEYQKFGVVYQNQKVNPTLMTVTGAPTNIIAEFKFTATALEWAIYSSLPDTTMTGSLATTDKSIIGMTNFRWYFGSTNDQNSRLYGINIKGPSAFTILTP